MELAATATNNGNKANYTYGADPNNRKTWDAGRLVFVLVLLCVVVAAIVDCMPSFEIFSVTDARRVVDDAVSALSQTHTHTRTHAHRY